MFEAYKGKIQVSTFNNKMSIDRIGDKDMIIMCVSVCVSVSVSVCVCVCLYVCMCVYMHISLLRRFITAFQLI